MVKVELNSNSIDCKIPEKELIGKRHLTPEEIQILEKNQNKNMDPTWQNFYVDAEEGGFNPYLVVSSIFSGYVVLGKIQAATLNYNDLHLSCGISYSYFNDVILGDYVACHSVKYLWNYKVGNRVILFNVEELCCTKHSKFGNGLIKEGETEDKRIWIGVANENDGRRILPFESMIPADAYLWSHYRDDEQLLQRFVELTEFGQSKELNTMGFVDDDCVIKNSRIIKDAKIGKAAYIKGALKLKNITILSSEAEPTQIGEGVEMVNGILGYGCHVFYQAIAVRFVIGRRCQVKYGARILNSVLGDNSTISCCEVLNNLIFPFHEQHHNSSFLIATTVMGQSNIAAGATIGSNHNSRSPDGEIFAKRGFWPGLCSDFKHNSRFASFTLVSKGSYQYELDIPYPFALVSPGTNGEEINIAPAWWFMYDMFAITRNKNKFTKRDKRVVKVQNIETDPLAPDTMQEILMAIDRIIRLTAEHLKKNNLAALKGSITPEEIYQAAKDNLHQNTNMDFTLVDKNCQKKYGAIILKPEKAYKMYRKVIKYFAARTILEFCDYLGGEAITLELVEKIRRLALYTEWENVGGQIIPSQKVQELFGLIKSGEIKNWDQVHLFYKDCQEQYEKYKVRYALYLLEWLYSRPIEEFDESIYKNIVEDVTIVASTIYENSVTSREKDYTDYFRTMVYRNEKEMNAVVGALQENEFLLQLKEDTRQFILDIERVFQGIIH